MTFPSPWEEDRYYLTLSFIYIVIHVIQRRQYMYVLYDGILYLDEYMPWALNQTHLVSTGDRDARGDGHSKDTRMIPEERNSGRKLKSGGDH